MMRSTEILAKRKISLPIFRYQNYNIDYEITQKRSNQKNVVLRFHEGHLVVSAPKKATKSQLESIIGQQIHWIIPRLERLWQPTEIENRQKQVGPVGPKEVFLFGNPYQVEISQRANTTFDFTESASFSGTKIQLFIPPTLQQAGADLDAYVHNLIYHKLFSIAQLQIPNMVMELGSNFQLTPKCVVVKEQKSRWGSCSTNGSIYMNWRLIQAPENVLRYVAIHELAHLKEHNHSNHFWYLVESMMPDYSVQRQWLKTNGKLLFLIHR